MEINEDMGEFRLIYQRRVEYAPEQDQASAAENMKSLESALLRLGFQPLTHRQTIWDKNLYARVMGNDGAYVLLESYFDGEGEKARTMKSVNYDITGIESHVEASVLQIERLRQGQDIIPEQNRCNTCR